MNSKAFKASIAVMSVLLAGGAVATPYFGTDFSVAASAATVKLEAPDFLYEGEKTKNSVTLLWNEVEGADAYKVYIYDAAQKKYVGYRKVKGTQCTVKGLSAGKTYRFKVAAMKKDGNKYKVGKKSETRKVRTKFNFKAGDTISCDLFSVTLPKNVLYFTESDKDYIAVYDLEAKEADFGGFAFEIKAYEKPSDYYGMMDSKIGEIRTDDGKIYDVVVCYPSDIQYDYEKYKDCIPVTYDKLYNGSSDILKTIEAAEGAKYVPNGGMKGEDLYGDVLAKYKTALTEHWDSTKLESEDMSSVYYQMYSMDNEGMLDRVGFAYRDINGDGIEELLIGEVTDGEPEVIFDIYTMVDRKPAHVVSGWYRNRYYLLENTLGNEYSDSASVSGFKALDLMHNDTEFSSIIDFRFDFEKDPDQPYFISYSGDEKDLEQFSEEDFNQRKDNFGKPIRIGYTPFSKVK